MKKIIIIVMCLLICACSPSTPIEVQTVNLLKNKLFEIDIDTNLERYTKDFEYTTNIIYVNDQYVYFRVQDEKKRCYQFYKQDKNNKTTLIYQFNYDRLQEELHSLYARVIHDKLLLGFVDHIQLHTKIILIDDEKVLTLYDNDCRTWIMCADDNYLILNETSNQGNKIIKVDLINNKKDILINEKQTEFIQDITQISNKGFIYKDNNKSYYYDIKTNSKEKLTKESDTSLYGTSDFYITYELSEDKLYFINNNQDYYLNLNDINITNTIHKDIYMNEEYMFIALLGNVLLYDKNEDKLLSYQYDDIRECGDYYFYNNKIYYITRDLNVVTVYEGKISV